MFLWLARIYALCFLLRAVEPLFPKLKTTKVYEWSVIVTDPLYLLLKDALKEVLPVKAEQLGAWINVICILGVLIVGRILDFII